MFKSSLRSQNVSWHMLLTWPKQQKNNQDLKTAFCTLLTFRNGNFLSLSLVIRQKRLTNWLNTLMSPPTLAFLQYSPFTELCIQLALAIFQILKAPFWQDLSKYTLSNSLAKFKALTLSFTFLYVRKYHLCIK